MAKQATPIQFPVFRKEDFASDDGVSFVNQHFSQIATFLNALTGVSGPTTLPSGVDVQGATVTGLGAPQSESDAISAGHASANYGAQAQQPQLDLGGKHALKGLAAAYQTSQQNAQAISSRLPAQFNGSTNAITISGLTLQWGQVTTDINAGTLPISFPQAFSNAVLAVLVSTLSTTDRITYVVSGSVTTSGFTIANNGSSGYAYWLALGW